MQSGLQKGTGDRQMEATVVMKGSPVAVPVVYGTGEGSPRWEHRLLSLQGSREAI